MTTSRQSYTYALLAVLFWSTIPTAFKISLGELNVLHMLTIATFTSTIILFIILITGRKGSLILKTTRSSEFLQSTHDE